MKKKIYLLLTLVLSLFMFSGRVEAAEKLYCVYDYDSYRDFMLFQDENGSYKTYYQDNNNSVPKISDEWHLLEDVELNFDETNKYDNYLLSGCPYYSNYKSGYKWIWFGKFEKKLIFSDDKGKGVLVDEKNEISDDPVVNKDTYIFYKEYNDTYSEVVKNIEWDAECSYVDLKNNNTIYFYFNKDRYILINNSDSTSTNIVKFDTNELNDYFEETMYNCPPRLYSVLYSTGRDFGNYEVDYFLKKPSGTVNELLNEGNKINIFVPEPELPYEELDDCKKIFGDDLVKVLNDIMDVVKLIIPILLIVFGIIDFSKAMFSGNEENMAKSRTVFFKRILAAVLVFIAPFFINLILELANNVWSNIGPDTCITDSN